MTADDTVRTTGSTRHGDDSLESDTARVHLTTARTDEAGDLDAVTEAFSGGAADAAVRGVDEILGREVRLVTLPPATGEALSDRIEQVRHLARLHHPHLLEVYDVDGLAPDTESTLVLESVAGEPLPLVLRDGPVPTTHLARMGAQLASALAHAHAHHVEHGAIGPASILVHRAGAEAWLVGLTASLSGPLPVVTDTDDADDAAARRGADVRALARTLADVAEHGGDPDTDRLLTLLRAADSAVPPSATALSERLVRFGRDDAPATDDAVAARLVPVVASWSESPAAAGVTGPTAGAAVAVGPAVHSRGAAGVTPFAVVPAQRARRAGVLAAATATLALASGLVIWAGEAHVVRSVPQAEVGTSSVAPAVVPAFPAFVPALPVTADDSSGSSGGDPDAGSGDWTRTADSSTATESTREAPSTGETTTTPDPTTSSSSSSTSPVVPPVVPPTGPSGPSNPPSGPTGPTTPPTTVPPTTTTVPGTTMPGTPTTTPPVTTTTVPGTTTGVTIPPVVPPVVTTTTTVPPVSPQVNGLLAFGLF